MNGFVAVWPKASVTRTVNVEAPLPDGVPTIDPLAVKDSPAGSEPAERAQEVGEMKGFEPPLELRYARVREALRAEARR